MTTMNSKMLVAALTTATLAIGATTAKADHYHRSCGGNYVSYAPRYYAPRYYAPVPVVYAASAYNYVAYRPVNYVQPAYYPAPQYYEYAPAPVYRSYYAPAQFGIGFGYSHGDYHGHHGHYGGGFTFRVGG